MLKRFLSCRRYTTRHWLEMATVIHLAVGLRCFIARAANRTNHRNKIRRILQSPHLYCHYPYPEQHVCLIQGTEKKRTMGQRNKEGLKTGTREREISRNKMIKKDEKEGRMLDRSVRSKLYKYFQAHSPL